MVHLREELYTLRNLRGVKHTTLDPQGPGVVRIHLVPPKLGFKRMPSVVILNGQDILTLKSAWTILLSEFIDQINEYDGQELDKNTLRQIKQKTIDKMAKIYPRTNKGIFQRDLATLVQALLDVAYGKEPSVDIPYMSIGEYAKYMSAPHRMDLMISSMTRNGKWHCNQRCVNCYAAGQPQGETNELTTEEWKEIITKCREAGIPQLTFTGGEPTMRNDLVELIAYSAWFVTRLNTNGVLLSKSLCEELYKASLDSIQITLYSSEKAIHEQLTGVYRFADTVQGIENALEAGLNVSVNTPLCRSNMDYAKTLQFLHEKGVRYVSCSGIILTGNALDKNAMENQMTAEEILAVIKKAAEFCEEHEMEISFTSPGIIPEEELENIGLIAPTCGACMSNMAIAPNGDVVPCQSWLKADAHLGNMLKDPWKRIWNAPMTKYIRGNSAKMTHTCPFRQGF